jgi:hypothetical protein
MTEYDFSPEAYERYVHTQERIAHWVDETEEHRPQFGSATTPSSAQGTPPMFQPRPLHRRRNHSMHERHPSFSSSSDSSSSSSTNSSDYARQPPPHMPAFQPMYLQHPVADPYSNHYRQSSHGQSPPRASAYATAAPQIYGNHNGFSSSGIADQMKGMSLVVSHSFALPRPTLIHFPDLATSISILSIHVRLHRESWILVYPTYISVRPCRRGVSHSFQTIGPTHLFRPNRPSVEFQHTVCFSPRNIPRSSDRIPTHILRATPVHFETPGLLSARV